MLTREIRSYEARLRVVTITIALASVVGSADTNGTDGDVELYDMAEGEVLVDYDFEVVTPGSGGSVSSLAVTLGRSGDKDSIASALDGMAVAGLYKGTAGVRPRGAYGGETLVANLDPDGGHKLSALTAGELKVHLYVAKPDARTVD